MRRKQLKASDLKGLFIYQDKKHGTIYYDIFTHNGYILTASDTSTYTMSAIFIPAAIVIFYVLITFNVPTVIGIIISVVAFIIMQVIYRFKFLYKLPCISNYQRTKRNGLSETLANNCTKVRLVVLTILAFALTGACIGYIIIKKPIGAELIGLIILGIISICLIVITLNAFKYKKTATK